MGTRTAIVAALAWAPVFHRAASQGVGIFRRPGKSGNYGSARAHLDLDSPFMPF